jgi:hypothetical protein
MSNLPDQTVTGTCRCGKAFRIRVSHYDRVILSCQHPYWALQPRRNGPLVMFPWPGPALTRAEYRAKYPDEDKNES